MKLYIRGHVVDLAVDCRPCILLCSVLFDICQCITAKLRDALSNHKCQAEQVNILCTNI
jgi:hypothetical protein